MAEKSRGFVRRAAQSLRMADRLTVLFMVVVVCIGLFTFSANASTEVNTNIGGIDMTISRFSEIICGTFSDNIAQSINVPGATKLFMDTVDKDESEGNKPVKNQFSLGNVGNVLGYPGERTDTSNASNIWTDGSDASSKMMTLETLWDLHAGTGSTSSSASAITTSPMAQYIVWGSALNYMGIDEFRDAKAATDGMRMMIGYAAYIFFILAYSAAEIMYKVVELLHQMNIFMWIWQGLKGVVEAAITTFLGVDHLEDVALLKEIMDALTVMSWLRWAILGLLVLFFVASITIWKTAGYNKAVVAQQRGRNLIYRLIVMCIGIPVCGMIYTECLNIVGHIAEDETGDITKYVFQEFMDFEAWTTDITDSSGRLLSFKVGRPSSFLGPDDPYNTIVVQYDSSGQRFTITVDDEAIDVNRLVYSVNESAYGTNVTGRSDKMSYSNSFFGSGDAVDTDWSYSSVVNGELPEGASDAVADASTGETYRDEAYKRCRDLLLNYARSNTVSPDTLNNYYISDMNNLTRSLISATVDDSEESSATNQAGAANATVLEQLFGVNASEQRIWSFVDLKGAWIYPANDSAKNLTLLDTSVNGNDETISVELNGLAAASTSDSGASIGGILPVGVAGSVNGVVLVHGSTRTVIMQSVLSNSSSILGGTAIGSATTINCNADASSAKVETNSNPSKGNVNNYTYTYEYDLESGGMSPLAVYNYMHSKFENGTLTVYSPKLTTNAGVGMMHYSVTTPYSGIPELVQLLFTISVLFSLGIIGWVFGISLLINSIVQLCKALPVMFKIMMGSVQGFVEGLLIVFSVALELLVTVALYLLANDIIDFLIRIVRGVAATILSVFSHSDDAGIVVGYVDPETYAIVAGLLSTAVILWGTFNLLKWRVAITMSLKSATTKIVNSIFGTSAAMPTGASSGMLKAGAALAAGAMVAGSLADEGTLDDVVNDLTQSDLGTSLHDKISDGDWDGAMQDIKDYANGSYVSGTDADGDIDRGENSEDEARKIFGDGASGNLTDSFGMQSLTDEQAAELDDKYKDDAMAAADKLDEARKSGDQDAIDDAQKEFDGIMAARAADAAAMRAANGEKARELGVADYGDYLRAQKAEAESRGLTPIEGADIPDEPEKELTSDAQMAYDAARDGDAESLRSAANTFDANGLTEDQVTELNEAIANGASESEIADMVEGFAEENFGENHAAVVDKMNEAAGRSGGALYGSSDNSDGKARTVAVASGHAEDGSRAYGVRDNNSDEGVKTFNTNENGDLEQQFASEIPEDPGQRLSADNQEIYDAAVNNDQEALAEAANTLDENGLTAAQAAKIDNMVESGASASDIAAKVDEFANSNLGENHKAVMERVNAAAGRSNTATYGKGLDPDDRSVSVRARDGSMSGQGSDWGVTDSALGDGAAETMFQADGKGGAAELPTAISDVPSKDLTSENQAIFEAARDGDTGMLQQMSGHINAQGLTVDQERAVQGMIASGASEAEVAAAIDNFAQDNFGNDYKQVIGAMNQAAGRDGTVTYSASTGGGEDGTQPRAMQVEAGYANGAPAYSVDDLGTEEGAHMVQVSDSNGQSIYQDLAPSAKGEQIVTSDFGTYDGQTYASIRSEVDNVANASGGMIVRGSGAGGFGETTVSEAASEIASRQSQAVSGGSAAARVGTGGVFAGSTDINRFNAASRQAVANTGLQAGEVAGISGGVDKHGMATTTLPSAGDLAGQPVDLRGDPVVNAGTNDGVAQMIAAPSVDSYGRSQAAMAQNLGVETVVPGAVSGTAAGGIPGAVQVDQAGGVGQTVGGNISGAVQVDQAGGVGQTVGSNIPGAVQVDQAGGVGQTVGSNIPGAVQVDQAGGVGQTVGSNIPVASSGTGGVVNTGAGVSVLAGGVGYEVSGSAPVVASGDIQVTPNGSVTPDSIPVAGVDQGVVAGAAGQQVAGVVTGTVEQPASGGFTRADIPMALGLAAAATTFVKTGNLGSAAMAYTGTQNAANDIVTKVTGAPAQEVQGQAVQTPVTPAGQVQYTQQAQPVVYNQPGAAAVNTATVTTVSGGNLTVARGSDGVIRTVDTSGNITSQAVAMTSDGSYQTVTQTPNGSLQTAGTGQQVVQTTDGSYVVVTQDASGNTVMANGAGESSGTILTRTSDGYQPAVTGGNGVTYSVNESGQATGSVVVRDASGGSVSVVRHTDGSVQMATGTGAPSGVVMAAMADGTYTTINNNGTATLENGSTVQVVRMADGTSMGIARGADGNWYRANGDGTLASSEPVHRTDSGWAPGVYAGGSRDGGTVTVHETTREITHETSSPDYQSWFQPMTFGFNGQQPQIPWQAGSPAMQAQGPVDMNVFWQQQMMQYMDGQTGQSDQAVQPSQATGVYTPEVIIPDSGDGPAADWDNGGTYHGSDDR